MKSFICGEKIENAKRALITAMLFQIYAFIPLSPQSEFADKQTRRQQFIKRKKSAQTERRKRYYRTLSYSGTKKKKKKVQFVRQALFQKKNTFEERADNPLAASRFKELELHLRKFLEPDIVALAITKLASATSAMHLLRGEKRPSKIIATLTLATNSIIPELAQRTTKGALKFSKSQVSYFYERFGFNPFSKQAEVHDNNDKRIAWIEDLPLWLNNWEAARQSPAFEKFSELISIIATMGFIDGKRLQVSVKGFELFRLGTIRKHANATDLVSAVLGSLEYFISGGYEFFLTGSPRKFLFDDSHAKEFDDLYEMLLEATPHAQSMNLPIMFVEFKGEKILMDDAKYLKHLEEAIVLARKSKHLAKNPWQTNFFQTRLDRMILWKADYNAKRSNGKFRIKPLSLWIFGSSGVGKSTLSPLLITSMLKFMGVPDDELDRVAPINEADPYDSTVTGGTHAYFMDDVLNTKAEWLKTSPTQKIVDHNNNAPLFANKAELEGKGVTPHRPKLTCYTSNCRIEEVSAMFSNCTESINRRMMINLDVRVKEEFRIAGEAGLDSAKVFAKFGKDPMPDVWEIQIFQATSKTATGTIALDKNFKQTTNDPCLFDIESVMEYCYNTAELHLENQGILQEIQSTIVPRLNFCDKCRRAGKMCNCPDSDSESTPKAGFDIPPAPPEPILRVTPSVSTYERMDIINSMPAGSVSSTDESISDLVSDIASEIDPDVLEHQADTTLLPPPAPWFDTTPTSVIASHDMRELPSPTLPPDNEFGPHWVDDVSGVTYDNNDENIELQAVSNSFWSLIPGLAGPDNIITFQSSFSQLIAAMEYMPNAVLDLGDRLSARFFCHRYTRRMYWALWAPYLTHQLRNILVFSGLVDVIVTSLMHMVLPYRVFMMLFSLLQIFIACTAIVLITRWYRDRMSVLDRMGNGVQLTYKLIERSSWLRAVKIISFALFSYTIIKAASNFIKTTKLFASFFPEEDPIYQKFRHGKCVDFVPPSVSAPDKQSALEPEGEEEVKARDAKTSDWVKPAWSELHISDKARTTTIEQLKHKIAKNLYHITFVGEDDSVTRCDGLVLDGNNMLVPLHVFGNKTELKVTCRHKEGDGLNTIFKGHISLKTSGIISGVDLVYANAPFLNPHASLIEHFPQSITHTSGGGPFMHRDVFGVLKDHTISFKTSQPHSGGTGYIYALPYNTFNGLCMGVLLGEFDVPCIAGFHLLGRLDTPIGMCLTVTRDMITKFKAVLDQTPCLTAMSNGTFPKEQYGIEVINQSAPIHPNSPLNYLPKYSRITPMGNTIGRSSHTKSRVEKTIISDIVLKICDVPCDWSSPKFDFRRQWQASMVYSANTSVGMKVEYVIWAMNDYTQDLVTMFTHPKHIAWIQREFKPLDSMEVMCGRDGARFIDAVPKSTVKSFPLKGPKEEWIIRLNPELYEKFQCPVEIRSEVTELSKLMIDCFLRGERCYAFFKIFGKDEPTKIGKDRVRLVQAAAWAFQLVIRKYFLPLARLMSLFPKVSECAVGINAHGPEWDEYAKHMKQHGEDRILAGDYSKFDLRMPAQMIMASYKVMIDVAAKCGTYSKDDLTVMRGIATEISYSVVAYNGDMIIHNGSHPSGNNMTVYVNCIDNILNFRCGFAHLALKNGYTLETIPKFKDVCALGTYGDDAKGSVKKGFDWFNHISFANFLEENDIIFTMPDKESEPTAYMNDTDADFLKRKNLFNPETGLYHGALDEDSIFKSLHAVLKSTIGKKKHAAGNIQGALNEWFHHGREVFTKRHAQMIKVAEEADLQNMCVEVDEEAGVIMNSLYDNYDVRLEKFKTKYMG